MSLFASRRPASTQQLLGAVVAVEGSAIVLRGGALRGVLALRGANLAMRSPGGQEALFAGWAQLLNALDHPVQFLTRVTRPDIEGYLRGMRGHSVGALAELGRDHAAFVRRLPRERRLLERRFYVVVPADGAGGEFGGMRLLRRWWRRGGSAESDTVAAGRVLLAQRCDRIAGMLGAIGPPARRLDDAALTALLRATVRGATWERLPEPDTRVVVTSAPEEVWRGGEEEAA